MGKFKGGRYGRRRVIMSREERVEIPSNLDGILRVDFKGDRVENKFKKIKMHLVKMGKIK